MQLASGPLALLLEPRRQVRAAVTAGRTQALKEGVYLLGSFERARADAGLAVIVIDLPALPRKPHVSC